MDQVRTEITRLRDGQQFLTEAMHGLAVQQAVTAQSVAATSENVDRLTTSVNQMGETFAQRFASRAKFELVEKIVFTTAAVILLAVLGAALNFILKTPHLVSP